MSSICADTTDILEPGTAIVNCWTVSYDPTAEGWEYLCAVKN